MNLRSLILCVFVMVLSFVAVGCGSTGSDDNGGHVPDVVINVDYGNGDDSHVGVDTVGHDNNEPADNGHQDVQGVDLAEEDHGTVPHDDGNPTDTHVGTDENPGDTSEKDILDHSCEVPTCSFTTTSFGLKDNCDGTMSDTASGLMWQKIGRDMSDLVAMNHQCGTLFLGCNGGQFFDDWRVPTIEEVRTLVHGCPAVEDGGSCTVTSTCYQTTCLNDPCDGCTMNAGPIDGKYMDPIMETVEYGSSYSVVLSITRTPKTASDTSDRFYYIQNYNAKLSVVAPLVVHPSGSVFCVRNL